MSSISVNRTPCVWGLNEFLKPDGVKKWDKVSTVEYGWKKMSLKTLVVATFVFSGFASLYVFSQIDTSTVSKITDLQKKPIGKSADLINQEPILLDESPEILIEYGNTTGKSEIIFNGKKRNFLKDSLIDKQLALAFFYANSAEQGQVSGNVSSKISTGYLNALVSQPTPPFDSAKFSAKEDDLFIDLFKNMTGVEEVCSSNRSLVNFMNPLLQENEDPIVFNNMAKLFDLGRKYEKEFDYEKATEHYRLAADQGHQDAQFKLGYMYDYGGGVEIDVDLAIKYYQLALTNEHPTAGRHLERLLKHKAWQASNQRI